MWLVVSWYRLTVSAACQLRLPKQWAKFCSQHEIGSSLITWTVDTVYIFFRLALYSAIDALCTGLSSQKVQAVWRGTPDSSSWSNVSMVDVDNLLGENDIMPSCWKNTSIKYINNAAYQIMPLTLWIPSESDEANAATLEGLGGMAMAWLVLLQPLEVVPSGEWRDGGAPPPPWTPIEDSGGGGEAAAAWDNPKNCHQKLLVGTYTYMHVWNFLQNLGISNHIH